MVTKGGEVVDADRATGRIRYRVLEAGMSAGCLAALPSASACAVKKEGKHAKEEGAAAKATKRKKPDSGDAAAARGAERSAKKRK